MGEFFPKVFRYFVVQTENHGIKKTKAGIGNR